MRRFGVSLILLTAVLGVPAPASAATGATTRVSVASDGTQTNSFSLRPAFSADGRYVAFHSLASNLVPGDTNGTGDVFVHDRVTGSTERVSVAGNGTQANAESRMPAISADGRHVVFESLASNLVPGDTSTQDVFVRDRVTGSTERVSVAGDGTQANAASWMPAISGDGRYIAFFSDAGNLVPGDTNNRRDVFVRDRATGSTERVSVASDGTQGSSDSLDPAISADGRYVAFTSTASNLVPSDTNFRIDVFVRDRATGSTERVSVASDGGQANDHSHGVPAISADGRYVAFRSLASNLVPGDTNGLFDVFVHDRATGSTERVSVASDGTQANSESHLPAISADGRYVAFQSSATNLAPSDSNSRDDVFVRDRVTGGSERVSVASDGAQANGNSAAAAISGDGRYVAFHSSAGNLVPGDTNGLFDVFVRDREGGAPSDTTQPTLTLPDPITIDATEPGGAPVSYTATATDDTDPNPTVSCAPPSGYTFPIGTTTVDCTATDATGNQATGSFTVTVVGTVPALTSFDFRTTVDATEVGGDPVTPLRIIVQFSPDLAPGTGPSGSSEDGSYESYGPVEKLIFEVGRQCVAAAGDGTGITVFNDAGVGHEDSIDIRAEGTSLAGKTLFDQQVSLFRIFLADFDGTMFYSTALPTSPAFADQSDVQQSSVELIDADGVRTSLQPGEAPYQLSYYQPQATIASVIDEINESQASGAIKAKLAAPLQEASALLDGVLVQKNVVKARGALEDFIKLVHTNRSKLGQMVADSLRSSAQMIRDDLPLCA